MREYVMSARQGKSVAYLPYVLPHTQDYPVRDVVVVGELLAIAMSCPDVEVIDLNSLTRRDALRGHLLAVSALASLGDGQRLVSGSHDTFLRFVRSFLCVCFPRQRYLRCNPLSGRCMVSTTTSCSHTP